MSKRRGSDEINPQKEPRYPISSVDNALKLLLMFREEQTIRVSEASKRLGVVRSTAHRLLAMLEYHGFVRQDAETKLYTSGPALVDIGLSIVRQMDVRRQLRPYLQKLSEEVGETVHLMVLDGSIALFLDSVESSQALRTSSRVGRGYPAHTTSGGKALLAELSAERFAELYPDKRIPGITPHSITTRDELARELQLVRERGYATNRAESESDIAAVAVVLPTTVGHTRAAIAVSAPLSRLDEAMVPTLAKRIDAVAGRVASEFP